MTPEQAAQYAYAAGFRGQNLVNIVAIMGRESGYNPNAYNGDVSTGDNSVGLTQINMIGSLGEARLRTLQNMGYQVSTVAQATQLLKRPEVNLAMAYAISNSGQDLSPWGAYKGMSNTYATDLPAAQAAVERAGYGRDLMSYTPGGNDVPFSTNYVPGYTPPVSSGSSTSGVTDTDGLRTMVSNGYVYYWDDYDGSWKPVGRADSGTSSDGIDHFFDVSGDTQATVGQRKYEFDNISAADQAQFGLTQQQIDVSNRQVALDEATLKQRQAEADRDYALRVGDQALAIQKQSDANYWQGEANRLAASQQALDARGQDMTYASQMAQIAQAKRASDQDFQIGMANATNDQQRNEIAARWNQEQAAIAKMEDETKRILGGQANQTAQFGAETDRAVGMGNLALDNNKFIADMASGARGADLFSLYFMQRGIAPDFNTIANGGTPATGAALAPADVMHAYTPTTAAPVFNGTPQNQYTSQVGQATAQGVSAAQANNPFIGAFSGGEGSSAPAFTPTPWTGYQPGAGPQQVVPQDKLLPQGDPSYSGLPRYYVEGIKPGESGVFTTGGAGPSRAADFEGFNVYDADSGEQITGQVNAGQRIKVVRLAGGGYTRAKLLMTGDANAPDPAAGGAVPEIIENPEGAKLRVHANPMNLMKYGVMPRFATGTQRQYLPPANVTAASLSPVSGSAGNGTVAGMRAAYDRTTAMDKQRMDQERAAMAAATARPMAPGVPGQSAQVLYAAGMQPMPLRPDMQASPYMAQPQPVAQVPTPSYPQITGNPRPNQTPVPAHGNAWANLLARMGGPGMVRRFALGTDTSAAYAAQGMGDSYIPTSNNAYLSNGPAPLPQRLQALADYGFPVTPGLYAGTTGQTLPANNVSGAFTVGRQAGVLPSLQTLNNMTPGEQELYKGYTEGVAKVPWRDVLAYMGNATKSLGSASRARVA